MYLTNPKADASLHAAYKKRNLCATLISAFITLAAIVVATIFLIKVKLNLAILFFIVPLWLLIDIIILIIGTIITAVVHSNAYAYEMNHTQGGVEIDLKSNMALCDFCGRNFDLAELKWKLSDEVQEKTIYGESRDTIEYKGTIMVSGVCPKCHTAKSMSIVVDLGEDVTVTKHELFTQNYTKSTESTRKTPEQLAQIVKNVYNKCSNDGNATLNHYLKQGYAIAKKEDIPQKDDSTYTVFLYSFEGDIDTGCMRLECITYCSSIQARIWAENGGKIREGVKSAEADKLIATLTQNGFKASKRRE